MYPSLLPSFPQLESQLLEFWREESLFQRSLRLEEARPEFVFYEGPPTANGRPGLHHLFARTLKDLVCRYRTMRGWRVRRMAGWDTHGLPVELEAERALGLSGKTEVERLGVSRFVEVCRESVFTYKEEWERLSERTGYWLDYERPYLTCAPEYVESLWWAMAELHARGFLYRGERAVPFCPSCETALASHEVAQGYREVRDPAVTFAAPWLTAMGDPDPGRRAFLVWTTTPWTLPANVALALSPGAEYVEVEHAEGCYVLAAERAQTLFPHLPVRAHHRAEELEGLRYLSPFAREGRGEEPHRVVLESFVSREEGTGVVHLAPAYGPEDYQAAERHHLPVVHVLDSRGRFLPGAPAGVEGRGAREGNEALVRDLAARGRVVREEETLHSYPHCWRCRTPLLWMARPTWYARTTAVREEMLELSRSVAWHPAEVGSGRFGEWLENNVDWALSRERYWGTPLPLWVCDHDPEHVEVVGSFAELARKAGPLPQGFDPHKPQVDRLTWTCSCGGRMRRTPEVLDVWFDSGAVPFAQWHAPFENRELACSLFPAHFVCEGQDQTRGWFYSLLALSAMLGRGAPYRNVLVAGLVLDAEGQKMSKTRGNAVDPWEPLAEVGADRLRWYLTVSSHPGTAKRYHPEALREAGHRFFGTLENTYRMFALYANLEGWTAAEEEEESPALLDRWVRSRLATVAAEMRALLDAYDPTTAYRRLESFLVDDLSNWYLRRSRRRLWGRTGTEDLGRALSTLHFLLVQLARLLAPVAPFLSDALHRALTAGKSVHLAPFPGEALTPLPELEARMERLRTVTRLVRSLREQARLRVRQPLREMQLGVSDPEEWTEEWRGLLQEELNLKHVEALPPLEVGALEARPLFASLGPRFGPRAPAVAARLRQLSSDEVRALLAAGEGAMLEVEGEEVHVLPGDWEVARREVPGWRQTEESGMVVRLDLRLDPALEAEGVARDLVHHCQQLRRERGLEVSDRVRLHLAGPPAVEQAARTWSAFLAEELLASDLRVGSEGEGKPATFPWEEGEVQVWLAVLPPAPSRLT